MEIDQKMLGSFVKQHTQEALRMIESATEHEVAELLEALPIDLSITLIEQMNLSTVAIVMKNIPMKLKIEIFEQLHPDRSGSLLRHLNQDLRDNILEQLSPELQRSLRGLLAYSKEVVGAHLDPTFFTLTADLTVAEGLDRIKKRKPDLKDQVYVLDRQQYLTGSIALNDLITADSDKTLKTVMKSGPQSVPAQMNISGVFIGVSESYEQLPVVDEAGKFLGIITKAKIKSLTTEKVPGGNEVRQAGSALAELYLVGLSSLVRSTGTTDSSDTK